MTTKSGKKFRWFLAEHEGGTKFYEVLWLDADGKGAAKTEIRRFGPVSTVSGGGQGQTFTAVNESHAMAQINSKFKNGYKTEINKAIAKTDFEKLLADLEQGRVTTREFFDDKRASNWLSTKLAKQASAGSIGGSAWSTTPPPAPTPVVEKDRGGDWGSW